MASPAVGYGLGGCGCLLTLISAAVAAFGAFHVFLDPRGAISADEAAPALGGGACCFFPSMLMVIVGIVLAMKAKGTDAAATPGAPGGPAG